MNAETLAVAVLDSGWGPAYRDALCVASNAHTHQTFDSCEQCGDLWPAAARLRARFPLAGEPVASCG